MIDMISALTLTAKLGICIAVFVVLIIVEILALVMLAKWKKNYKNFLAQSDAVDKQNQTQDVPKTDETSQDSVEETVGAVNESTTESENNAESDTIEDNQEETQDNTQEVEEDTQELNSEEIAQDQPQEIEKVEETQEAVVVQDEAIEEDVAQEDIAVEEETVQEEVAIETSQEQVQDESQSDKKTDDNKLFAFAPLMLLSAALPVAPLRYLLYALVGVSVVLAIAVITTAIVFAKSLTKSEEQPAKVEEKKPEEQPVEETPIEAVEEEPIEEEPEQIIEDEVTAEEQPIEETPAEEVEEELIEEQPIEEEPVEEVPADEDQLVAEEQPVEEVVEEEPVVEEPKPVRTKRPPVPREQTMVLDDVALVIKDDRFLFNPSDDGYYYILEKTFTAKLIQSDEYVKDYYAELKNELLSYKKVHARMSKKRESFNYGRVCIARLTIRGKTLRLHLDLDAKVYEETKYKVEDTSDIKSLADTSLMYRIKNDRRLKYAKDLIATVMAKYDIPRQETQSVDYTSMYPYEETPPLIERGLITRRRAKGKVPEGNGFDFAQKTFKAKLIQAEDFVKEYYSQLKNCLLSYRKVHDRMSKKRESFRFGRTCVARMNIRGKTLRLYLALNPQDFVDTKYKFDDVSDVKSVADTPLLIKIKNNRRLKYAIELIEMAMANVGTAKKRESDETDYVADLPFESLEELMEKGLVTNVHVEGNSFVAQHFTFKAKDEDAEDEAAADEDE